MNIFKPTIKATCNGCGQFMRDMGEWPVQIPPNRGGQDSPTFHTVQCRRFACSTCKTPSDTFVKGYPVMIALFDDDPKAD